MGCLARIYCRWKYAIITQDNDDVWTMFAAIATHKFVITFCVSLELLQAGTSNLGFGVYLVTFSLVR